MSFDESGRYTPPAQHGSGGASGSGGGANGDGVNLPVEETALAIISQAVNDETLMQVVSKDTAAKVWTALRSMHVDADRVKKAKALGEKVEEKYVIKKLLRAVSDKFINIAMTIEFFGSMNTMTKEKVIGSLKT
ncbi:hypothetical protein E2562_024994 [Oryza meyeriana var. granulata]|uniref:Uncharacterized protein n=1 Tax=Oryza meyeriana var. granulata TaxID=110450 RepID=A0A6G1FC11_9ORYZ|nr:hypothetical protein E2562_024994 [Oryza meyeriana var. granulata]